MELLIICLVILCVVGALVWAVQRYLPFEPVFKNLICFILIVVGVLVVVQRSGLL